ESHRLLLRSGGRGVLPVRSGVQPFVAAVHQNTAGEPGRVDGGNLLRGGVRGFGRSAARPHGAAGMGAASRCGAKGLAPRSSIVTRLSKRGDREPDTPPASPR